MIKLGEKIKSLRKQKNISQEVFANYLGVSFQAVSKWENGNTILVQLCRMAFLTSSRMRRSLNISSFVQSASNSPIFSFATAYVPGVFARRIQSVATSSASAMRMSVDNPGVFLPSSMLERCTTEISAFSASSPCVSPTSRRKSAMRLPMAEGLQFLFIAFHPFACNTNGDCTSGFAHGNTVSVFFHLPYRNIFVCCNPCHCAHLLCKHTQYHKGGMKSSESGKVSN